MPLIFNHIDAIRKARMQGIEQRAFRLKFRHYIHPELEYSEKKLLESGRRGIRARPKDAFMKMKEPPTGVRVP